MEKLRSKSFYNFPKTRTAYFPMTPSSFYPKFSYKFSIHQYSMKELIHSYKTKNIHNLTPNKSIQTIINDFTKKFDYNNNKHKSVFNSPKHQHNNSPFLKRLSLNSRNIFGTTFHSNKSTTLIKKHHPLLGINIKCFSYFTRPILKNNKNKKPKPQTTFSINDFLPFHLRKPERIHFINKKHYYLNSKQNIQSTLLGTLSIFILISSQGEHPETISTLIFNYLINYFTKSNDIPVCQKRDNYYTIITSAFTSTSTYINTLPSFNAYKTGAACLLILIPQSIRNKIFCANVGDGRAVLLGHSNPYPLSYQHVPLLQSEKERIEMSDQGYITNGKVFCKGDEDVYGLNVSRGIGWFMFEKCGLICEPEIIECDVFKERGRCIVIGNNTLWEWLSIDEVNKIIKNCYMNSDTERAGKDLIERIVEKWMKKGKSRKLEEINGVVILFK